MSSSKAPKTEEKPSATSKSPGKTTTPAPEGDAPKLVADQISAAKPRQDSIALYVFCGVLGVALIVVVAVFSGVGWSSRITDPNDLRFVVAEASDGAGGKFIITQAMLTGSITERLNSMHRSPASLRPEEKPWLTKLVVQDSVFKFRLGRMMANEVVPDLDLQVQEFMERYRAQFSSDADMENVLKGRGLTVERLREAKRVDILRQSVIKKHLKPYKPTEEEIDEYYNTHGKDIISPAMYRWSQILIKVYPPAPGAQPDKLAAFEKEKADIRASLNGVRELILRGDHDFATLARQHSDDQSSKDKGGDCGYVVENGEVPELFEKIATLPINEVSEVFETPYGFHIIKVTEKVPQGIANRSAARSYIIKRLTDLHQQNQALTFVKQVITDAKIVYYVPVADKPPAAPKASASAPEPQLPAETPPPQPAAAAPPQGN
ncbi:hypothetical protein DB346_15150 [Verrucomicrobia bacterium LW23]|nr:hypothetical protein DB346_15150 [Verrucomicrobia bacterium LW23]